MHIKRSIVFPAAVLALAVGSAYAADTPNFNQMDKNNDGALTRDEARVHEKLTAHFDQVDDDGDGRLTRGEYLQIMARQDLYSLRDSVAEFINPEGKPPLATAQQGESAQQSDAGEKQELPMAASRQMVRNVQDKLNASGVDAGPVDGIWGPRTHQALREFQKQEGLQASGQLNAETLTMLGIGEESASAGSSPEVDRASGSARR